MKKIIRIFITVLALLFLLQTVSKANDPCVFITLNSAKYHLAGCDYMTSRPHPVSLSYAKANGYGPCQHCRPYMPAEIEDDCTWLAIIIAIVLSIIVIGMIMYFYSKNKKGKFYNKVNNKVKYIKQKFKRKDKTTPPNNYQNVHVKIGHSHSIDVLKVNNIHQDAPDKDHNRKENKEKYKYKGTNEVNNDENSEKNKEIPMKWYKFWNYVKLPSFIIINWLNFFSSIDESMNPITLLIFSLYIWYVMSSMYNKRKNCFTHIKIILVFETIAWSIAITDNINPDFFLNLFIFIILLVVWFLPNYVYFNKRKDIFVN